MKSVLEKEEEEISIPLEEFLLLLIGKAKDNHFIYFNK